MFRSILHATLAVLLVFLAERGLADDVSMRPWPQSPFIMLSAEPGLAEPEGLAHTDSYSGFAAGDPGDPMKPARVVHVVMREGNDDKMNFTPNKVEVKRGEQIRFILTNTGAFEHEFILATSEQNLKHAEEMKKNPDMEHSDPNGKRIDPQETKEIVWRFSRAGQFEFGCLIPGHREAGMMGVVIVK